MQHGDGLPGLYLIQAEGQGEAPGELFDATEGGRRAVDVEAELRQHLVEQLQK